MRADGVIIFIGCSGESRHVRGRTPFGHYGGCAWSAFGDFRRFGILGSRLLSYLLRFVFTMTLRDVLGEGER